MVPMSEDANTSVGGTFVVCVDLWLIDYWVGGIGGTSQVEIPLREVRAYNVMTMKLSVGVDANHSDCVYWSVWWCKDGYDE